MVCVGKTNLSELAYSGLGLNPHFGTPRNPRGSGPARDSGRLLLGLRGRRRERRGRRARSAPTRPARSACRPRSAGSSASSRPRARVDRAGVLPLAPTLDSVGPLATSVADAVALDALLRGAAPPQAGARRGGPAAPRRARRRPRRRRRARRRGRLRGRARRARARRRGDRAPAARRDRGRAGAARRARQPRRARGVARPSRAARRPGRRAARPARAAAPARRARAAAGRATTRCCASARGSRPQLAAELDGALAVWPTVRHAAPELEPLERDDELFARVNLSTLRDDDARRASSTCRASRCRSAPTRPASRSACCSRARRGSDERVLARCAPSRRRAAAALRLTCNVPTCRWPRARLTDAPRSSRCESPNSCQR